MSNIPEGIEINKAIAELVYPDAEAVVNSNGDVTMMRPAKQGNVSMYYSVTFDYINNWNLLMPLVVEHGISIEIDFEYINGERVVWNAYKGGADTDDICVTNKNPQLALAQCLYLVLLAKKERSDG